MDPQPQPEQPEQTEQAQQSQPAQPQQQKQRVSVDSIVVKDENTALNVLVGFLHVAQKRGAFEMNEASKIYECINFFKKPQAQRQQQQEQIVMIIIAQCRTRNASVPIA